jgi:glyoxylate reductase
MADPAATASSVLVTKHVFPEAINYLEQQGMQVEYMDSYESMPSEELLRRAQGKQALVAQLTDKLSGDMMSPLRNAGVRVIANVAVGFDNIDIPAATRAGILVTNTPGVLTETTADFAFSLLMAAARRVVEAHAFVHSGQWKQWTIDLLAGQDVHHKTLGIFGMGRIGQAMARRARGFGMRLLYHDAQRASEDLERELALEFVEKEALLQQSDFVTLHVPLLESTRKLIGEAELRLMKPTAILINTARGPVVDEAALADALERKTIAGAGLDVFEREPQVLPKLLELSNVVLAPHIASASVDTRRRMCMIAAENAVAAVNGQRPPNPVNPEVLEQDG